MSGQSDIPTPPRAMTNSAFSHLSIEKHREPLETIRSALECV